MLIEIYTCVMGTRENVRRRSWWQRLRDEICCLASCRSRSMSIDSLPEIELTEMPPRSKSLLGSKMYAATVLAEDSSDGDDSSDIKPPPLDLRACFNSAIARVEGQSSASSQDKTDQTSLFSVSTEGGTQKSLSSSQGVETRSSHRQDCQQDGASAKLVSGPHSFRHITRFRFSKERKEISGLTASSESNADSPSELSVSTSLPASPSRSMNQM